MKKVPTIHSLINSILEYSLDVTMLPIVVQRRLLDHFDPREKIIFAALYGFDDLLKKWLVNGIFVSIDSKPCLSKTQ